MQSRDDLNAALLIGQIDAKRKPRLPRYSALTLRLKSFSHGLATKSFLG
jgi:hypothetical protein